MSNQIKRYGPWAIVTGASQGIGAGFAEQLAKQGYNLVLVSRRPERLSTQAEGLRARHGVETRVVGADLSVPGAAGTIIDAVRELDLGLLVSNAGAANMGGFLQVPLAKLSGDLVLNALSHMELSHAFASHLRRRGRSGGILLISSTAALQPMAFGANYSAAKALVLNLGEALNRELAELDIDVTVLLPGPTDTEGLNHRGDVAMNQLPMPTMSVEQLVREGLSALARRRPSHVAGFMNRWSARLMPRRFASWMISTVLGRNTAPHLLPAAPLAGVRLTEASATRHAA